MTPTDEQVEQERIHAQIQEVLENMRVYICMKANKLKGELDD